MFRVVVSSLKVLQPEDRKPWRSPEWARIWETKDRRLAVRRVKELRHHGCVVVLLRDVRGVVEVVNVKA